ncbi:Uncharacterized protein FWK35_00003001 [Aphis craccivora]|uniref:Uncharacterized protein n=1 Tax=Aphis craccivora TaxID=307492 RepID=A0A6G0YW19_APHCR|nr:Uncharacterized protein FWK35_00003001 [Aphis craccivora]
MEKGIRGRHFWGFLLFRPAFWGFPLYHPLDGKRTLSNTSTLSKTKLSVQA